MQASFINTYGDILSLREERESLLSDNIANTDTPGYKAIDIPFEAALGAQILDPQVSSNPGELVVPEYRANTNVGLDGNDVSLDLERIEASKNGEAIDGAVTFLHQSTADMVTALRPNPGGI